MPRLGGGLRLLSDSTLCPEKSEPLKHFATTCVNLHQIKYIFTHTATCISNDVLKFLKLLRLHEKSDCKQNHSNAHLLSTQKVITVPTFKVDVESVLRSHGYTFTVASVTD